MQHYHLIGIGGIGMSAIAKLFRSQGKVVTGSDIKESKITEELKREGIEVFIGHSKQNLRETVDTVVYSSAIKEDNPEIREAKRRGLRIIKRAEALVELMEGKTKITITGSHGKTTTTSLTAHLLLNAGFNPTVAVGGVIKNINENVYTGNGGFFVAEADESDGSFLCYEPEYSIITNIDYEHLDYYKDFQNLVSAFGEFINKTKNLVLACADDQNLRRLLLESKKEYLLFGLEPKTADYYPVNICTEESSCSFDLFYKQEFVDNFRINLLGMHNVCNSLAVIALGLELKIDKRIIKEALESFSGVKRRIDIKYKSKNYIVIDDYAHHPTEIKATLKAVQNLKRKRIIALFQPHRYTRTKLLLEQFARAFDSVDILLLTDIYPAGEEPIQGISSYVLYEKFISDNPQKEVFYLEKAKLVDFVLEISRPGDLVITLGAGDITYLSDVLAEKFREKD